MEFSLCRKNENSRLSNSIPNQVIIDKLKQSNILKNRMENLNIEIKFIMILNMQLIET